VLIVHAGSMHAVAIDTPQAALRRGRSWHLRYAGVVVLASWHRMQARPRHRRQALSGCLPAVWRALLPSSMRRSASRASQVAGTPVQIRNREVRWAASWMSSIGRDLSRPLRRAGHQALSSAILAVRTPLNRFNSLKFISLLSFLRSLNLFRHRGDCGYTRQPSAKTLRHLKHGTREGRL
jgi:hypothetical protein